MPISTLRHVFFPDMTKYGPEPGMGLLDPQPEELSRELLKQAKPHHRKAVELALTDLFGRRAEAILRLPRSWEHTIAHRILADPRDLPIALSFIQCTLWIIASVGMQLALLPRDSGITARSVGLFTLHMVVTWYILGQRFILAMHYGAHRSLISPKLPFASALNMIPQLFLANFWGMPAGMYHLHHCVMHHGANNVFPWDLSGTTAYRRDTILGLVHYIANFVIHTFLFLPYYAVCKRRYGLAALSIVSMTVYFAAFSYLHALHPPAFWISLGVASAFGPCMLMMGNFAQHQFINPKSPTSNYGLTINLINAPFNMLTYNDGYHIVHHLNSVAHWSELPLYFIKNLDEYEAQDSLIFHSLDYMEMSALVYTNQLEKLATYAVQLRPVHRTPKELAALMRERLQPMPHTVGELDLPKKSLFGLQQLLWIGMYFAGVPSALFPALLVPVFFAITYVHA